MQTDTVIHDWDPNTPVSSYTQQNHQSTNSINVSANLLQPPVIVRPTQLVPVLPAATTVVKRVTSYNCEKNDICKYSNHLCFHYNNCSIN